MIKTHREQIRLQVKIAWLEPITLLNKKCFFSNYSENVYDLFVILRAKFYYVCSAKTTYLFDFRFLPGAFFVYNEFTLKLFDLQKSSTGIKIFCPIRLSTSLVKLPNPKTDLHTNVHNDAGVYTVDSTMASYDLIQTILTQHKK